ncbi:Oligosaccharide translocation protein rft1 [Actinomortierella ambigua]|nr:Oligosaccharide translocation protein rft1 [Actinomortierella ambigua]
MDDSNLRLRQQPSVSASTTSTASPSTPLSPLSSSATPEKNGAQPQQQQQQQQQATAILSSSVQGASYLILLQFVSRMLTFTLNQVLLRFTTAETLGIASVQLELLLNTILFLSREGVRCAAIRVSDDGGDNNDQNVAAATTTTTTTTTTKTPTRNKKDAEAHRLQKLVNMVYAPIPVGAVMTMLAIGYSLSQISGGASEQEVPGYRLSIYLYGLAALVELVAEPMFMVAQYKLWFKSRVSVEGKAVVVRCVLTFALTIFGARHHHLHRPQRSMKAGEMKNSMGVLAFAIAQFVYGWIILVGFLWEFWNRSTEKRAAATATQAAVARSKKSDAEESAVSEDEISLKALLPRPLVRIDEDGRTSQYFFDPELLKLSRTLTAQSLLKHILTEGDKMLMASMTTSTDQGVYAFVVNYGSLVARILFQPMEETSRTLFSKLLSNVPRPSSSSSSSTTTTATATSSSEGLADLPPADRSNLILSRDLLLTIMKFHVLLGLVFIAFGTHYTATLVDIIGGKYWSQTMAAPAVLALYCYYVPIMGLNGITEAVVQAVASEKELGRLSFWMVGFSAVFCGAGALLTGVLGMGAQGIVLANCVNLAMRIVWSCWFLSGYYGRHLGSSTDQHQQRIRRHVQWGQIVPHPIVLVTFAISFVATAVSEHYVGWHSLRQKAVHVLVGAGLFVGTLGIVALKERMFIRDMRQIVRGRR